MFPRLCVLCGSLSCGGPNPVERSPTKCRKKFENLAEISSERPRLRVGYSAHKVSVIVVAVTAAAVVVVVGSNFLIYVLLTDVSS
jgi:hypothetical protein